LYRIDYWIVKHYCSDTSLGLHIQVSKVVQALIFVPLTIHTILFQQVSQMRDGAWNRVINKLSFVLAALYTVAALFIFLFGDFFIELFWGSAFKGMKLPLLLTMPGVCFLGISYLHSGVVSGMHQLKFNMAIAVFCFLLIVMLDLSLIPRWGINGAAVANSICFLIMFLLYTAGSGTGYRFKPVAFKK
jgi:O-antigen/teichoic acid export membrane protein